MRIRLNLLELRKKKGISQYKVAKELGISPQMLGYYERAHTFERWAQLDMEKLAALLECDVDDLYDVDLTYAPKE